MLPIDRRSIRCVIHVNLIDISLAGFLVRRVGLLLQKQLVLLLHLVLGGVPRLSHLGLYDLCRLRVLRAVVLATMGRGVAISG